MLDTFSAEVTKSGTPDDPHYDWRLSDRIYKLTSTTFTKRQCRPHERVRNSRGGVAEHPFNRERLENERDSLRFIAEKTNIPVPRVIEWSEEEGAGALTVEAVQGELMKDLMHKIPIADRETLKQNVDTFLLEVVLPQLAALRSTRLGQLSGVLVPPPRVSNLDHRPVWEPKVSNIPRYVYCHNDLARQNIMIDPKTLQVVSIIDWEYSGFFPAEFEYQFWHRNSIHSRTIAEKRADDEESLRLAAVLDEPGDLDTHPRCSKGDVDCT